ncbi:MAG TPA: helix-hairpin-helix domain-containing protein [Desulfobacterales bacterium]|nr:helix-hairpin-helix domain-containing protein [Desulfobacterales bacterium]MDP7354493.1 helix-hairpin-helix domain-containing protein [Desulfobacterales bacterium]HJO62410.1 helix-hairpin-helix domain-containing protein [Desulfobacterales bacterium]
MGNQKRKICICSILVVLFCGITSIDAKTFKIVSYNLENLFDLTRDGTEYPEYIPNTGYGWTKDIANIKYTNIARVIKDLAGDVVALQEVESKKALINLRNRLKDFGVDYPYLEIADNKATVVKCAVLSKFPIVEKEGIEVDDIDNEIARNILRIMLDIDGNHIILLINHWKSKRGPESMRIAYAKRLRKEIEKLNGGIDFILIGDFNSNYNEHKTFQNSEKLNDSGGITGINHILGTIQDTEMINEEMLANQTEGGYLYNLWLEIRNTRRWSYNFFGKKGSPDNIIVSKGLYDGEGISYEDNSFDKFHPSYLFKKRAIYRWQRAKNGTGKHLGKGYSDHLPIFAYFSTNPFCLKADDTSPGNINPIELEKSEPPKALLDPNTASREELMSISGIGPVLSERIVAGRPYRTVDDLLKVKAIGPKRLKKIRPYFLIR